MLTKSLSCEWADKGIRVNAMCLGYMRTEISEDRYDPDGPAVPDIRTNLRTWPFIQHRMSPALSPEPFMSWMAAIPHGKTPNKKTCK